MNEPRNCYRCIHGNDKGPCPACSATGGLAGKVWPSVPNEVVLGPGDVAFFEVEIADGVTRKCRVEGMPGRRIIVQPLEGGS